LKVALLKYYSFGDKNLRKSDVSKTGTQFHPFTQKLTTIKEIHCNDQKLTNPTTKVIQIIKPVITTTTTTTTTTKSPMSQNKQLQRVK